MSPLLALALASTGHAATLLVDPRTTGAHPTIQQALRVANAGDRIEVEPGTYTECLNLQGVDVTIAGKGGTADTVLDCQSAAAAAIAVEFGEGLTLEALTVRNAGRVGIRLDPGASLWGRDLDLSWLGGAEGGAIVGEGAGISLEDSVLAENIADEGGAIRADGGWVSLLGTTVEGNFAVASGGAVALRGGAGMMVSGGSLSDNASGGDGGAVLLSGGAAVTLDQATLHGNEAGGEGGAIALADGSVVAFGSQLTGNTARHGGAIAALGDASVDLDGTALSGNSADEEGGDILSERGTVTLRGVTASGSTAAEGAALFARTDRDTFWGEGVDTGGTIRIEDSILTGGVSSSGAAIMVENRPLVIAGGEVSHTRGWFASAIKFTGADLSIADADLTGNGGELLSVYEATSVHIARSAFRDNRAGSAGTGPVLYRVDEVVLEDLLFVDNDTHLSPAVVVADSAEVTLRRLRFYDRTDGDSVHLSLGGARLPSVVDAEAILVHEESGAASTGIYLYGALLDATLRNTSVLSPGGTSWGIEARDGAQLTLIDSHVAGAWSPVVLRDDATLDASHCAWDDRVTPGDIPGPGHIYDAPALRSGSSVDGLPLLSPAPGSPLIDAGDPSGPGDADGTRSDIGFLGGQAAGAWDLDGDGYTRAVDCDDGLAGTHPDAPDEAGDGVDSDCDGADGLIEEEVPEQEELPDDGAPEGAVDRDGGDDRAGLLAGLGCSSRPGGPAGPAGLLALGLLLLRRRCEG